MRALFFALCLATPANAQCPALPGFTDIPGLPIYAGACLIGAADDGHRSYDLPTGPYARAGTPTMLVEGTALRRLYVSPPDTSAEDMARNYTDALTAAGYKTLFSCVGRDCGSPNALLGKTVINPTNRHLKNIRNISGQAFGSYFDERYTALQSADGTIHIGLYTAFNSNEQFPEVANRAITHLDVITAAGLQARMTNAAEMAKGLTEEGHIALDNVYFEFGTATLTPEATPTLNEMAKLLTDNPGLNVYIVGHTDSVGTYEANLTLSQARAAAVVGDLTRRAGLGSDRAIPAGVGPLSPVASNSTDAGRAINRRVELVER